MARLFTALDIPPAVHDDLMALRDAVEAEGGLDGVRWVPSANLHVTLRFIGEADREQAFAYAEALEGVDARAFQAQAEGLAVFPSRRRPRVIVARVGPAEAITAVYEAVDAALQAAGLAPEDRAFSPHVTLARLKDADADAVGQVLDAHDVRTDPFFVDHVTLYESTRTPQGAAYLRRAALPLRVA
jgi:2'-5' RNA ligase